MISAPTGNGTGAAFYFIAVPGSVMPLPDGNETDFLPFPVGAEIIPTASRQSALRSILLIAKYPPASLPLLLPTKFRLKPHSAGALKTCGTHKCVPYGVRRPPQFRRERIHPFRWFSGRKSASSPTGNGTSEQGLGD